MEPSESTTTLPSATNEDLTPLEQDVLDEYERLGENMKKVDVVTSLPHFAFEN
jgi:DASH complex subunit DAD3